MPDEVPVPTVGKYVFKLDQELLWFIAVAVLTTVAQLAIDFKPEAITDWRVWAVSGAAAIVRAAGGALSAWLAKQAVSR